MKKLFEIPSAEYVEVADVIVTSGGNNCPDHLGGGNCGGNYGTPQS